MTAQDQDKEVVKRFLRYVKIDTQSEEDAEDFPSTRKQLDLAKVLAEEMKELGVVGVEIDEYGYVMGTLPSNLPGGAASKVPTIGLISHMDTSPEAPGAGVKPQIIENYDGRDIQLPGDTSQAITLEDSPELKNYKGKTIITSDGTTLLGADDKAGCAEIMAALVHLGAHPEIKHGELKIGFTPDEEVGRGVDFFDVKKFGADYAYTIDGSKPGSVEIETFNASTAIFTVEGYNVHPGYAKNKMVNSLRAAAEILARFPPDVAPETTEKREGYLHPHHMEGSVSKTVIKALIRDFDEGGMQEKKHRLEKIVDEVQELYPGTKITLDIKDSYRNMREVLDRHPRVVENAMEAVRRAGLTPRQELIRGGTDGARLCFMGLPTPNIFTGGQNFHSKREWIAVEAMEQAVDVIVNLVRLWAEKAENGPGAELPG